MSTVSTSSALRPMCASALSWVVNDGLPPFLVGVVARWLEACPVSDLDEDFAKLRLPQAGRVGVGVQNAQGPPRLGEVEVGTDPACLAVVGRERKRAPDGDRNGCCLSVVDRPGEVHVQE